MSDMQTPASAAGQATSDAPIDATAAANAPSAQAAGGGRSFLPRSTLLRHLLVLLLSAVGR
jgi:branched-chain amino acid transport system permease protein